MFPDNFFSSYLHIAANLISIGKVTKNNDTSKRISRKNSEITKYHICGIVDKDKKYYLCLSKITV